MSPRALLLTLVVSGAILACQPPPQRTPPPPKPTLPVLLPSGLGLAEPIALDVLFGPELLRSEEADPRSELVYATLTSSILDGAFSRCLAAERSDWIAAQRLLASDRNRLPELFRFPALILAQLSEGEGPARLRVRLFDLSCTDYRDLDSGTFVPSTWERALIFEETQELSESSAGGEDAFGWSLIEAWDGVLADLLASRRFQEYRGRLDRGGLDIRSNGTELLGVIREGTDVAAATELLFADAVSDLWSPSEQVPVEPPKPTSVPSPEPTEDDVSPEEITPAEPPTESGGDAEDDDGPSDLAPADEDPDSTTSERGGAGSDR